MQSGTRKIPGSLDLIRTTPSGATSSSTFGYSKYSETVSASIIRRGNRKSPNPWSYSVATRWVDPIAAFYQTIGTATRDDYTGQYVGPTENLATWHSSELVAVEEEAFYKLLDNIRGNTDVSVDAFQARQTMRMGSDAAKTVAEMQRITKSLGARKLTAAMKVAGSAWLQFQYGVKPTLSTLFDVAKFSTEHYRNQPRIFEGRSTRRVAKTVVVDNWPDNGGWTSEVKLDCSYRCYHKVRMTIPDDTTTQAARLSSLNPASIAWELLPWSFVADWFFNLGDYLRGVETSAIFGRYFTDGFRTLSYKEESTQVGKRSKTPPGGVLWGGRYTAYAKGVGADRALITSFPGVPTPRFEANLGSGRLLNAAALLTNFLKR